MADHTEDNDPFEEDIVFDQAGLLGGKMPRSRQQATVGFLPTFMLFIRTVFLCIAFIGLGLCASVSGGPLIRLEIGMGVEVDTAFHIFTSRSIGMLLGGLLGSLLFDVYNRQFLMFVSLVWVAVSVTVLPFTVPTSLWWTFTTTATLGMGLGFLFTGGNVLCLDLWGRQGGASLQALHFSFAVGACIAPLVIHPFFIGLHPAEIHNITDISIDPTTTVLSRDVQRERVLRAVDDNSNTSPYSYLPPLSINGTKELTFPSDLNVTDNFTFVTEPTLGKENYTLTVVTLDIQVTTTTKPPINNSLVNPPPMKPSITNGNKLEPDRVSKWKKPVPVEISKPKTDPTPEPKKPTSTTVTSSTPMAHDMTTAMLGQIKDGIASNLTSNATIGEVVNNNSSILNSNIDSAKGNTSTLRTDTGESLPSTTILYPLNATTTTTSAPIIISSPTPAEILTTATESAKLSVVGIMPPLTTLEAKPITSDVQDNVSLAAMQDHPPDKSQEKTNSRVLEPELLDLKEPEGENVADTAKTSGLPSIMHLWKPGTYSNRSDENSQFLDSMAKRFKDYGVTKVHLAYICIGIFIILNALISVVILCHNPREPRSKQDDGCTNEFHKGRMIFFMVVFSVFMFMAESLQGAVHHLLASTSADTGLKVIQESEIDGQALFWGLVCLVRFLCILLSGCLRLKPGKLLTMAVLFSVIGSVFLAIGSFGKEDFLWGGIIFMSLGLAPILPTSLLWMAQYMRVTHRMCALMIVLASFGNSLTHTALTHVAGNSHLYAYVLIFISIFSLFFLLISMCVLYTALRSKTLGVPIGYQLASQHEEEDSIELTPSGSAVFTPSDPRIRENGEAGQSLLID